MKTNILTSIIILIISFYGTFAWAQTKPDGKSPLLAPPDSFPTKIKFVGKAKVEYVKNSNQTRVFTIFYGVGKPAESGELKDVLIIEVVFYSSGQRVTKPDSIQFIFNSFSSHGLKYQTEHKLVVYTDGCLLLSQETQLMISVLTSNHGRLELMYLRAMKYADFISLLSAKKVTMKLGNTEFELKENDVEALRNLKEAIEP